MTTSPRTPDTNGQGVGGEVGEIALTEEEVRSLSAALYGYPSGVLRDVQHRVERILAARIAADRAERRAEAMLCSQCGERMACMVKIGTDDGWCATCLDEAAEPAERRAEVEAEAVTFAVGRDWPTPNNCLRAADALDALCGAKYGDILRAYALAEDARFEEHGPLRSQP